MHVDGDESKYVDSVYVDSEGEIQLETNDSPGLKLFGYGPPAGANKLSVFEQFEMYLLWMPDDGEEVPLGVLSWGWSGVAVRESDENGLPSDWILVNDPEADSWCDSSWRCVEQMRRASGLLRDLKLVKLSH